MFIARRSSRSRAPTSFVLPANVLLGISTLVAGNESTIGAMLSVADPEDAAAVELAVVACMRVNSLTAEGLLGQYFDKALLGKYCEDRLGKSGKGNAAVLASRIFKEWAKPSFTPLPPAATSSAGASSSRASSSSSSSGGDGKGAKKKAKTEAQMTQGGGAAGGGGVQENDVEFELESLVTLGRSFTSSSPPKIESAAAVAHAIAFAAERASAGDYPVELESLWLCVLGKDALRCNLLPVATEKEPGGGGGVVDTEAFRIYEGEGGPHYTTPYQHPLPTPY